MKESLGLRFLYNTASGRIILRILVKPELSRIAGVFLSSRYSKWIIPLFVKKNQIDMERFFIPEGGYSSFNDFFTRKLKENNSNLNQPKSDLISPCDGLLTIKEINDKSIFEIKNCKYRLLTLLNNNNLGKDFSNGTALIFRLTPTHYHRYAYCTDGMICECHKIKGFLHCVRPIATEKIKVFVQNSREYTVISSSELGKTVQMEVGAMLVGKISNNKSDTPGNKAVAGKEKGYFEYGGSTIIVLVDHKITIREEILNRTKIGSEIPVSIGEALL